MHIVIRTEAANILAPRPLVFHEVVNGDVAARFHRDSQFASPRGFTETNVPSRFYFLFLRSDVRGTAAEFGLTTPVNSLRHRPLTIRDGYFRDVLRVLDFSSVIRRNKPRI